VLSRLCAVGLLTRHTSDAARQQLLVSARAAEPTVAAAALQILLSIDPALVLQLVAEVLQNRDANVRMCGVEAYVALPTVDRVAVLASVLDDVHTGVRGRVREALFELAKRPDLDATVRGTAQDQLAGSSWRGQEQAALLLAALDHKPAAPRLIELLESERSEVMEVSAWALRMLALPETGPALLDKADRQTTVRLAEEAPIRALDRQVAHLFEALGRIDHTPAIPLMLRYVPKAAAYGEASRAAAIWSLGLLHRERPNPELAQQLFGRATDNGIMPAELEVVKRSSVVSLGWMRSQPHVEGLRKLMGPVAGTEPFSLSVRWSIMQITGEELPLPMPPEVLVDGGFLVPVK
jgi:HEAT repeat protein